MANYCGMQVNIIVDDFLAYNASFILGMGSANETLHLLQCNVISHGLSQFPGWFYNVFKSCMQIMTHNNEAFNMNNTLFTDSQ